MTSIVLTYSKLEQVKSFIGSWVDRNITCFLPHAKILFQLKYSFRYYRCYRFCSNPRLDFKPGRQPETCPKKTNLELQEKAMSGRQIWPPVYITSGPANKFSSSYVFVNISLRALARPPTNSFVQEIYLEYWHNTSIINDQSYVVVQRNAEERNDRRDRQHLDNIFHQIHALISNRS